MKSGTADMIEGQEAFDRFRDAAKKMMAVPKERDPKPVQKDEGQKETASVSQGELG